MFFENRVLHKTMYPLNWGTSADDRVSRAGLVRCWKTSQLPHAAAHEPKTAAHAQWGNTQATCAGGSDRFRDLPIQQGLPVVDNKNGIKETTAMPLPPYTPFLLLAGKPVFLLLFVLVFAFNHASPCFQPYECALRELFRLSGIYQLTYSTCRRQVHVTALLKML